MSYLPDNEESHLGLNDDVAPVFDASDEEDDISSIAQPTGDTSLNIGESIANQLITEYPDDVYTEDMVDLPSETNAYQVIYLATKSLDSYDPFYLSELHDAGAVFYAVYDDDSEVEVSWDEVTPIDATAEVVLFDNAIANAINQHFWSDTNGVHISEIEKDNWDLAVSDNFSDLSSSKNYYNILMNSLGLLLRRALYNLVSINRAAISFYDGLGNESSNIMASFGRNSAQIGRSAGKHIIIDNDGITAYDGANVAPLNASNITAAEANIQQLQADTADISTIRANSAKVQSLTAEALTAATAYIAALNTASVTANDISANKATIAALISGNVTTDTLRAASAYISSLVSSNISASTLTADHANLGTVIADYLTSSDMEAERARVATLIADYATVTDLNAATARIGTLETDNTNVKGRLTAAEGNITTLTSSKADITDLNAATARIGTLETENTNVKGRLTAAEGSITTLTSSKADITDLNAATARIGDLEADIADIDEIRANSAKVENLTAAQLEADHATVGRLSTTYATIANLNAATGRISDLESTRVRTTDLEANYITADAIEATYTKTDLSNTDVAWIQNGTIKNGAITNAMINSVSANKLTAGTIDASVINVTNLQADDISVTRINGQTVSGKTLVDALEQHEDDISDLDDKIDTQVEALNDRIDGAIETFTGTAVPTLTNSPASSWNTTKLKDQHVGDVYYVVNSSSQQNGYCYRFTKSGSSYSWQLIKDSDVTAALGRLQTAEGKISTIEQFDSDISSWKTDTDDELASIKSAATTLAGRVTTAEGQIATKVETSTFNTLSQTVDENSASISQLTTETTTLTNRIDTQNPFIIGTQTAQTGNWTGNASTLTSLVDGQQITYWLPFAPSGNASLNLTLKDGTTTGAIPCYYSGTSRLTTHYAANNAIHLTYRTNISGIAQGWWADANYDSNSPYTKYSDTVISGKNGLKRYTLCMRDDAGNFTSIVNQANNASVSGKTCYTGGLQLGSVCYHATGGDYAAGANSGAVWESYGGVDFRYSVNGVANAVSTELQLRKPIYLVGTIGADGLFYLDTTKWWTQTSFVEDKAYVFVGTSYSSYYAIFVAVENPTYIYEDGELVEIQTLQINKTTTKVNTVSDTVDEHTRKIGLLETSVESKADGSTVETMSTKLNTVSDTVNGHTQSISSINSTLSTKADSSTVSTLSTKVNTIEDTVDGHTQSLQSVTSTQTSIQQNAVKSTVQLWFTKANTTAPNKPTAHVTTNNAATGNAWNLAVPTYNASYPNYYYCYEYQYLDGSYGWSAVTRDIATGEMQERARTAITNAAAADTKAGNAATAAANAQADIDNLDVGGRNLVRWSASPEYKGGNVGKSSDSTGWYAWNTSTTGVVDTNDGIKCVFTGNSTGLVIPLVYDNAVLGDEVLTISFDYRGTLEAVGSLYLLTRSGGNVTQSGDTVPGLIVSETNWQHYEHTFTFSSLGNRGATHSILLPYTSSNGKWFEIKDRSFKLEKGNRATDWTPAPEDVDADISTAQTAADAAQATADKNVKESVQLWITKASSSAPAKPTSKVTSTAVSGNAWTTKVPTYNSTYPYYFYCIQYISADGTVTWSDVVYDQATTEAQSVARTATTNLSTLQQDYATFKQTTQNFESTIGSTYATKTEVSAVQTNLDNLEIGGRNLLRNTNWNSETIKNFKTSTSSTYTLGNAIGEWHRETQATLGFDESGLMTITVPNNTTRYGIYQDISLLPGHYILSVDTGSFFKSYIDSVQWPSKNAIDGSNSRNSVEIDVTEEAVYRVYISFNNGAVMYGNYMKLEKGNKPTDWTPAPEDVDSAIQSIPRMAKINLASRNFTTALWKTYGTVGRSENWGTGSSYDNSHLRVGDRAYITGTISDKSNGTVTIIGEVTNVQPVGSGTSYVTLKSEQLIFGGDVVDAIESRVTSAETSITQNNQQIALKANASDVYTKSQTDGLISTEVSNRNSAIEQSAAAINLSVSQTYTTKTEFNNLEIGGRNLLRSSYRSYNESEYLVYDLIPTTVSLEELGVGTKITIQLWDVELDENSSGIRIYWGGGSISTGAALFPDSNGYACATVTILNTWVEHAHAKNKYIHIYNFVNGHSGASLSIGRWKIEKGTKPTDWTPAPEDMVSQTEFESAKAEIKVTTDGITSEVSKISSIKHLTSTITNGWTLSNLKSYATDGQSTTFNVTSTTNVRVGDTVYIKGKDSTRNCPVYIKATVTQINSATQLVAIGHGYSDALPVDSAISSINQSAETIKIQASRVEIDGTAIFNSISSDVDSAITNKGYATTSQAQGYATTAKNEAISAAASDATTKANAVQTNLDNLKIGGRNLLVYSTMREYVGGNIRAAGSYYSIVNNEIVATSQPLNNQLPGWQFPVDEYILSGTTSLTSVAIWVQGYDSSDQKVGGQNSKYVQVDSNGYFETTIANQILEGSSYFNIGIGATNVANYSIKPKLEKGNRATDWTPAPEDQISTAVEQANAPLQSKRYTGIIGTENSFEGANFFFGKLYPDSYDKGWQAKLRIECEAPNTYQQSLDITFGGYGSTFSSYDSVTSLSASRAFYYVELFKATSAGITANAGHMLGISLQSATNPANSSYARTIRVDVLSTTNCSVVLNDTVAKYSAMAGYSTTNYGSGTTNLTQMNVATAGQNATNNANTNDTARYVQYYNTIVAGEALAAASLIGGHEDGKFYQISGASDYFILSQPLLWLTTALSANATNYANIYTQCYDRNLSTYYSSFTNTLPNKIVYLVGTIDGNKFTVYGSNSSTYLTVTEPTTADGRFYIPLGRLGNQSNGKTYFNYQVSVPVILFAYIDGKFRQVNPTDVIATQKIYYRTASTTAPTAPTSWVTTNNAATYNAWNLAVPPLAANKNEGSTKYAYLYSCEQRQRLDGTISCGSVSLDSNATIIDGGQIITNSITALQIAANSITATEIDATNLHVSAANVDGTLTIGKVDGLQNALDNNYSKIMSRGEQLIVNGNGFMGNNTNFSSLIFDGSKANNSPGSFTSDVVARTIVNDELFPIDTSKTYRVEFDVLATGSGSTPKMYAMLMFYDIDKNLMNVQQVSYISGSTTTLARDLNDGDTVIYLTDVSGFIDTPYGHQRSLIFWDYTNSFGYTYPPETYSKDYVYVSGDGLWSDYSKINKTNNTITLSSAWNRGSRTAGTPVSQNSSGSSYAYFWWNNDGSFPIDEWVHVSATYSGLQTGIANAAGKFYKGTSYCKIGWLWNYQNSESNPQKPLWVTNISVKEDVSIPADTVKRTHRIYYRKSAVSVPATPSTAAGNWVTQSGDVFNQWTTKVPRLTANADGTGTKYLYLYTCEQHEMGDGKLVYTTVLLDDSATIIDGGNIITGTVSANAINASSGTFNTANIPNLSADKITSGTIDAARIDASALTIGGSGLATQSDVTTAVDTIDIGGRNYLLETGSFENWYRSSGITVSNGITTFPSRSSLSWITTRYITIPVSEFFGNTWTFSLDYRSDNFSNTSGSRYIVIVVEGGSTYAGSRTKYYQLALIPAWIPTTTWQRRSVTFEPTDISFLSSGSGDVNYIGVSIWSYTLNSFQVRRPKLEKGNRATDWSEAPEDVAADINTLDSSLTTEINQRKAKYGTCSTTASDATKMITCSNYELVSGSELTVKFSTANTSAGKIQFNINGKGAKDVWVANAVTSATNQLLWGSGAYITIRYDGTQFIVIGEPRVWYGASTTAAATAAKTDTTVATGCVVCKGTTVNLHMTNANGVANPTLNIASTGAKAIYSEGSRPTASGATNWSANATVPFIFDGQYWKYDSNAARKATVAYSNAEEAKKTATNYITADTNGIKIHMSGNSTTYQHQTSTETEFIVNDISRAMIGGSGARFGKTYNSEASDNESHMELDYHSMKLIDKNNVTYFYVSDLRDQNGDADIKDVFYGDGLTTEYQLSFTATSNDYTITLSDGSSSSTAYKYTNRFELMSAPASGVAITVLYKTKSSEVKAFTFGTRKNGESIGAYSFSNGTNSTASGYQSIVLNGYSNVSSGKYSISSGTASVASDRCSVAIGYGVNSSGKHALAFGLSAKAIGNESSSIGNNTTASGSSSHAEGCNTTAFGFSSHAEGHSTIANGSYSHAQGYNTKVNYLASCSVASGIGTIASGLYQTVIGQYNEEDSAGSNGLYAFIIGNGTADNARSNALTVDWSGNLTLAGGITLGTTLADSNLPTKGSAGTAGTSSATSGATLAVPYITTDAYGRVTAKGTHTHTIDSLAASAIGSGTFSVDRLPTVTRAKGGTGVTAKQSSSVTVTTANATAGSINYCWHNGVVATVTLNCTLKAALANGSTVTVGTVPSGYRPASTIWSVCYTTTSMGPIGFSINSSGTLSVVNRSGSSLATSVTLGISTTYCI